MAYVLQHSGVAPQALWSGETIMQRKIWTAFIALGFATGVAAQASRERVQVPEGRDRTNMIPFDQADANKDGTINREEANMIAGFDFSRADTDNNLTLNRAEYAAALARSTSRGDGEPGPRSGDRTAQVSFEAADANKDGKVDRNEAEDIPGFNFTSADVDDDKSLSREEFRTAMANSTPRG
jgi:Ca2+-binding EF-hand superfamily protein